MIDDLPKIKEPLWDKSEWLILISNLQKNNFQPLESIQKEQISKILKKYLSIKNNFEKIDDNYRNINGINWQSNNLLKFLKTKNPKIHLSRDAQKLLSFYKKNNEALRKDTKKLMFKIDYAHEHNIHFDTFNVLYKNIHEYELTIRTLNVLKNREIDFVYELIFYTEGELLRFSNFGKNSLEEVKVFLKNEFNLKLATDIHSENFKSKYLKIEKNIDIEPNQSSLNSDKEITNFFNHDLPDINDENLIWNFYEEFKIEVLNGRIINSLIDKENQYLDLSIFSTRTLNVLREENINKNFEIMDLYEQGKNKIMSFRNSGINTFREIENYVSQLTNQNTEHKEKKFLTRTEISYFLQPLNSFYSIVDLDLKLLKNIGVETVLDLYTYCKNQNSNLPKYFEDYLRSYVGLDFRQAVIDIKKKKIENFSEKNIYDIISDICEKVLKPKQFEVIKLRFGFYNHQKKTLEEISNLPNFGVTREMIRQTEAKALKKLRLQKNKFNQIYSIFYQMRENNIFKNNVFQDKDFLNLNIMSLLTEIIFKSKLNWLNQSFYKLKNNWLNINFDKDDYSKIDNILKKNKNFPLSFEEIVNNHNIDKKLIDTYLEINKDYYIYDEHFISRNEGYNKASRRLRIFSLLNDISKKHTSIFRIENIFMEYKKKYKDDDEFFYREIYQIIKVEFQKSKIVQNFKDDVFYFTKNSPLLFNISHKYLKFIDYSEYYNSYYKNKETVKTLYEFLKKNGPKRIYKITEEFQKMYNIPKGSTTRYISTNGGFHKLLPGLIGIPEHIGNKNLFKFFLDDNQIIDNYILLRHAGCNYIDFPYLSLDCDQIIAEYLIKKNLYEHQKQFSMLSLIENLLPNEKSFYTKLRSSLKEDYQPIYSEFENYDYDLEFQTLKEIIILASFHKSISFIYINKYVLGTRFQSLKLSIPYMICLDALGLLNKFKNYYEKVDINQIRLEEIIKYIFNLDDKNFSEFILSEFDNKNMVFFQMEEFSKISFDKTKKLKKEITDFDLYDY